MSQYKVLIAEDNELFASVITKILTDLSIETVTVATGGDVLAAFKNDYFDMVLLDIMMPEMNGLEVSRKIRQTNSHIPIVALTSIPYDEIKEELAANGINHYFCKPPKTEELKALLREYFKTAA